MDFGPFLSLKNHLKLIIRGRKKNEKYNEYLMCTVTRVKKDSFRKQVNPTRNWLKNSWKKKIAESVLTHQCTAKLYAKHMNGISIYVRIHWIYAILNVAWKRKGNDDGNVKWKS